MNTEFMYSVLKVYAIFLQRFQHWKEATIDAFVVAMHRLHQYYWNKMKRGLAGLGNTKCLIAIPMKLRNYKKCR